MVRVLVIVASRHGATREIGEAVATALTEEGIESEVQPPERVATIDGFDAVIIGSGVYAGHWLEAAKRFIKRHGATLRQRPVPSGWKDPPSIPSTSRISTRSARRVPDRESGMCVWEG